MTAIPEDCIFYHSIDLPGLGTVPGMWDHRETVDPYLGHVDVADKRVLEVGPASGFFTFELERRGARVVALELGEESDWDRVPQPFADEQAQQAALRSSVRSVRNAWLFAHRQLGAKAETVWGSVYEAPQLVGEVDVTMFGNVLQHLRDPVLALTRVGQVTRDTMIVSEAMWNDTREFRSSARMELIARADIPEAWASWWTVSPKLVMEILRLLGFMRVRCGFHSQRFNGDRNVLSEPRTVPHFTVVGRRMAPGSADPAVDLDFGQDWYPQESTGVRSLRRSKGVRAVVRLLAACPTRVDIAFGVMGGRHGDSIRVTLGKALKWEGRTLAVCGVAIEDVALPAGESVLVFETTESVSAAPPGHPQGMTLWDFGVARADETPAPAPEADREGLQGPADVPAGA